MLDLHQVMIDTPMLATLRDEVWAGVARLTTTSYRPIVRDDGSTTFARVPSLWEQSTSALLASSEGSVRVSNAAERSPVDLDLVMVRDLISRTTRHALIDRLGWRLVDQRGTSRQIRQLAALVVTHEPTELWWWSYRFDSWARLLSGLIAADEHVPASLRLRNSPCPSCGARQVIIDSDEGPIVVPPILIDFRAGFVRAAQCTRCGAMWWRGDDLERLADLLHCERPA